MKEVKKIIELLKELEHKYEQDFVSLEIFSDGSGVFHFSNNQEGLNLEYSKISRTYRKEFDNENSFGGNTFGSVKKSLIP